MLGGMVAVVTGGARGIGLATGRALARNGARVVLGDIDGALAQQGANELPQTTYARDGHIGAELDVRDEESCRALVDLARSRWGRVDLLVNCAGVAILGDFAKLTSAEQELQVDVNLNGVLRMTRQVLPEMLRRKSGRVVNIASAVGRIPAPRAAVYGATKHAIVGLTEALRWELRSRGIRVSAVLPTVVTTEMAAGLHTPGLPVVTADKVAEVVLRNVRSPRPRAVTLVPRWFAAAVMVDQLAPEWVRELGRRYIRIDGLADSGPRAKYRERVLRQLRDDPGLAEN